MAGITSVLLVMLMSQPRIFFSMSRDQLLPPGVSKVHPRFGTPYITTIITCVIVALVAGLTPIQVVGEMTSIGTLFAFVVVCAAVIMLRIKRPDAARPFKVPFGFVLPVLGVVSCLYLMLSLSVVTWVRFLVWLDIGMLIYWFYGRTHSPLRDPAEQAAQSSLLKLGNLVTMAGALVLFNGFFMAILGYMTEFGITSEATAKWHEIHVTPDAGRHRGARGPGAGVVTFLVGRAVAKAGETEVAARGPLEARRASGPQGPLALSLSRPPPGRRADGYDCVPVFAPGSGRTVALHLDPVVDPEGQGAPGDVAQHHLLDVAAHEPGEGHPAVLHHDADGRVRPVRVLDEALAAVDPAHELPPQVFVEPGDALHPNFAVHGPDARDLGDARLEVVLAPGVVDRAAQRHHPVLHPDLEAVEHPVVGIAQDGLLHVPADVRVGSRLRTNHQLVHDLLRLLTRGLLGLVARLVVHHHALEASGAALDGHLDVGARVETGLGQPFLDLAPGLRVVRVRGSRQQDAGHGQRERDMKSSHVPTSP